MATPKHSASKIKVIAIVGGIIAAVVVIACVRAGKRALAKSTDHSTEPTKKVPLVAPPSAFPIQVGSRSELVKQLQGYLGVTADGIFGPKTAAALALKTGKTSIIDQADFNAVISKLAAKDAAAADASRADKLVRDWTNNTSLKLVATAGVTATGINEDAYGALTANGKKITLVPGYSYGRDQYELLSSTQNGFLKFRVTMGPNTGFYKIDPNKVSVG